VRFVKIVTLQWKIDVLMAKHFFDSILFNMADMHLVMCLYK